MKKIALEIDGSKLLGEAPLGFTLAQFLEEQGLEVPQLLRLPNGAHVSPPYSLAHLYDGVQLASVEETKPVPALTPDAFVGASAR